MNSSLSLRDVIIIGAGPAGCAAALSLQKSGLDVLMLEKDRFPRDKICGDAIGSRVKRVLSEIDPRLALKLDAFPEKYESAGWKLFTPQGKHVDVQFVNKGYISTRIDFDNFLFHCVKDSMKITVKENVKIKSFVAQNEFAIVTDELGTEYHSKVVIACDGAHSAVLRSMRPYSISPENYSGAVRGYFKNVAGMEPNMMEIHLLKNFLPGYFWIFPLKDNISNVGFGMLTSDISRRKLDIKQAFQSIVQNSSIRTRFEKAEQLGEIKGFGLPLGGIKRNISGRRFILCGDAASLIDPLNGEGIGNAMMSGMIAARHALQCFEKNDFSEEFIRGYDRLIEKKLLPELKKKLFMQKLFNRPWLIESLVAAGNSNRWMRDWIGRKL